MPKLVVMPYYESRVLVDIKTATNIEDIVEHANIIYYNFIGDFTLDEVTAFAKGLLIEGKYKRVFYNNVSLEYIMERGTTQVAFKGNSTSCHSKL